VNAKNLIRRTRDRLPLALSEIQFLVDGATRGEIPDYQLTAWLMAVYFSGLTERETVDLTRAMLHSGRVLTWTDLAWPAADKHSTGGVGDKISFLVAPLVAAAGVPVPMISGRSLGHTGGTLDKLESIAGLRTDLTLEALAAQVRAIGACIAGQSGELAPADRLFYSLRDAASIVESVPLITASILSKKAAAGVAALALDVKYGSGAFMPDLSSARALANSLATTAAHLGIRVRALLTRMDRVLGYTAGNALEIAEAADFLTMRRVSRDLEELTMGLGSAMLVLAGRARDEDDAFGILERHWREGDAWDLFIEMVRRQGGDPESVRRTSRLPRAGRVVEVAASRGGIFSGIDARPAGEWITDAGGGRTEAGQKVDPRVGLEILPEIGDRIEVGEPVLRLHLPHGDHEDLPALGARAAAWIRVGEPELPRITEILG